MYEILIVFAVALLAQVLKKWIAPRFGDLGIHVTVFVIAIAGAVGYNLYQSVPAFQAVVSEAIRTLAFAVALYELILKRLGFSKAQ